jgi:hypothetical protein
MNDNSDVADRPVPALDVEAPADRPQSVIPVVTMLPAFQRSRTAPRVSTDGKTEPRGAVRDHVCSTGRLTTRNAKFGPKRRIFDD